MYQGDTLKCKIWTVTLQHVIHPGRGNIKRGHVTGTKREKKGAQNWYKPIAEANIRRIEAEWAAKQQGK